MDIKIRTRVKSITLEEDAHGQETEKCVLTLADKNSLISSAYLIMDFNASGRGSLHVGQELELNISISGLKRKNDG